MTSSASVQAALNALPTSRIQRIVDRLEADPDIEVTVCGWVPQCPMTLAGFEHHHSVIACRTGPEHRFAIAWDRFAVREQRRWWHRIFKTPHRARHCDVQALLRMANELLAQRAAVQEPVVVSGTAAECSESPAPIAEDRGSAAY